MHDMAHGEFVNILMNVADEYGCTAHKIDRYYPSSKTCTCGYVNKELKITDREWICPEIRGQNKSATLAGCGVCKILRIPRIHSWEYVKYGEKKIRQKGKARQH